jgi:hypothetical protein
VTPSTDSRSKIFARPVPQCLFTAVMYGALLMGWPTHGRAEATLDMMLEAKALKEKYVDPLVAGKTAAEAFEALIVHGYACGLIIEKEKAWQLPPRLKCFKSFQDVTTKCGDMLLTTLFVGWKDPKQSITGLMAQLSSSPVESINAICAYPIESSAELVANHKSASKAFQQYIETLNLPNKKVADALIVLFEEEFECALEGTVMRCSRLQNKVPYCYRPNLRIELMQKTTTSATDLMSKLISLTVIGVQSECQLPAPTKNNAHLT